MRARMLEPEALVVESFYLEEQVDARLEAAPSQATVCCPPTWQRTCERTCWC